MTPDEAAQEAERALLATMMLSPNALWAALELVTPRDFRDPKHEAIVEVMTALAAEGKPCDALSVFDELARRGEGQKIPADYLFGITSSTFAVSSQAAHYAELVQRYAALRRVRDAASSMQQGVADGGDVWQLVEKARGLLDGALAERDQLQVVGERLDSVIATLDKPPLYWPTRWYHLNNYIDGYLPGGVTVIAARPGAGKTIMGLQAAVDIAAHGPVLYFSMEMPEAQMHRRLIASMGDVPLTTLSRHTLAPDDWMKVRGARSRIQNMPLYIDDRSGLSMTQMEARVRGMARSSRGLKAVVVDYLQLIPNRDSRKTRWEHVGDITREFKILAKDLGIQVILLCQLNRESEKNQRLPRLDDLRESGSIEQDADVVILLQRRLESDGMPGDTLDVVIPKNRHGQTGRIEFRWAGKFARVEDMPVWGATPVVDAASRAAGDTIEA